MSVSPPIAAFFASNDLICRRLHQSLLTETPTATTTTTTTTTPCAVHYMLDILPAALLPFPTGTADPLFNDYAQDDGEWRVCLVKEHLRDLTTAAQSLISQEACSSPAEVVPSPLCDMELILLMVGPGAYTRWNRRKQRLRNHNADSSSRVMGLLQELVFTGLVLSKFHKIGEVWQHRLWTWRELADAHPQYMCSTFMDCWAMEDLRVVIPQACAAHPMNYNAWHYLRSITSQVIFKDRGLLFKRYKEAMGEPGGVWFEYVFQFARNFLRTHHSDGSCASFLVDWLSLGFTAVANDTRRDQSAVDVVVGCWQQSLRLCSTLLLASSSVGHECLWTMRLGLFEVVLHRSQKRSVASSWFRGGWTVQDELNFVAEHASLEPECSLNENDSGLLIDADFHRAMAQCSGGRWWHQHYALRYGIQFAALCSNPPQH